jgi:hypothetical protein
MTKHCLTLLLAAALGACGAKSSGKHEDTTLPAPKTADDPTCPLLVPGTSLSVEDTDRGAALVFVTTGDAAAVRTRAVALAAMHTSHDGPPDAMGMMFSPTSTATAKDIDGGARVEFSAKNPDDAAKVQDELRMHAGHLTGGTCEM